MEDIFNYKLVSQDIKYSALLSLRNMAYVKLRQNELFYRIGHCGVV